MIETGKRSVVLVAEGVGKFKPVDVEIGVETDGQTEIRKGLEAGQKVVVSGQFLIDSEASLKATTTRMEAMPAASAAPHAQAGATHRAEGKLEHIGKDAVTISHGPVPSLDWGPMTMDFQIPATGLPKDVTEGDQVSFEFQAVQKGGFELKSVTPMATKSQKP